MLYFISTVFSSLPTAISTFFEQVLGIAFSTRCRYSFLTSIRYRFSTYDMKGVDSYLKLVMILIQKWTLNMARNVCRNIGKLNVNDLFVKINKKEFSFHYLYIFLKVLSVYKKQERPMIYFTLVCS